MPACVRACVAACVALPFLAEGAGHEIGAWIACLRGARACLSSQAVRTAVGALYWNRLGNKLCSIGAGCTTLHRDQCLADRLRARGLVRAARCAALLRNKFSKLARLLKSCRTFFAWGLNPRAWYAFHARAHAFCCSSLPQTNHDPTGRSFPKVAAA